MAKVYGLDVQTGGTWKAVPRAFATLDEARDYGADKYGGHFHVWFNGDCVYDSQLGEDGPASPGPGDGEATETVTASRRALINAAATLKYWGDIALGYHLAAYLDARPSSDLDEATTYTGSVSYCEAIRKVLKHG